MHGPVPPQTVDRPPSRKASIRVNASILAPPSERRRRRRRPQRRGRRTSAPLFGPQTAYSYRRSPHDRHPSGALPLPGRMRYRRNDTHERRPHPHPRIDLPNVPRCTRPLGRYTQRHVSAAEASRVSVGFVGDCDAWGCVGGFGGEHGQKGTSERGS